MEFILVYSVFPPHCIESVKQAACSALGFDKY